MEILLLDWIPRKIVAEAELLATGPELLRAFIRFSHRERGIRAALTDETVRAADVVITMGCGDACPIFPGKRYLDWELPDPAGRSAEQIRPIRDEIDARVRGLVAELVPAPSS